MTLAASTSIAAYHTAPLASARERVLEFIESCGEDGCITDDVIANFRRRDETNTSWITARFSELESAGLIVRLGDVRKGVSGKSQLVMRAAKYSDVPVIIPPKKKKRSGYMKALMDIARLVAPCVTIEDAKGVIKRELRKAAVR